MLHRIIKFCFSDTCIVLCCVYVICLNSKTFCTKALYDLLLFTGFVTKCRVDVFMSMNFCSLH